MRIHFDGRIALGLATLVLIAGAAPFVASAVSGPQTQQAAQPTPTSGALLPAFVVRGEGAQSNRRLPDLSAGMDVAADDVPGKFPRAGLLPETHFAAFDQRTVKARANASTGEFIVEAEYGVGTERGIRMMTWSPTGQIELLLPLRSPVTQVQATSFDGHEAVLITPVLGVQGNPPVRAYVFNRGIAYYFEADGFADPGEALALIKDVVRSADK